MWWVPIGFDRLGPGCLVLLADTRENPGGKNRVMRVAPSLFSVSWHKERPTKNKMIRFLSARIFSIFVPILRYCKKSSSIYVSLSVRRAGSQSVDTRVKSQGRFQILGFLSKLHFSYFCFLFPF